MSLNDCDADSSLSEPNRSLGCSGGCQKLSAGMDLIYRCQLKHPIKMCVARRLGTFNMMSLILS